MTPPKYAQLEPYELRAGQTGAETLRGSRIRLRITANKPVVKATLVRVSTGQETEVGVADTDYFDALIHMFEQALTMVMSLPEVKREHFIVELADIRATGRNLGWGVGSGFNDAWALVGQKLGD